MSMGSYAGPLGRRPEDDQDQLFLDVMKAVLCLRRNEQQRPRTNSMLDAVDEEHRPPAHRVVNLVLVMRSLIVESAGRQRVHADAEELAAQDLGRVAVRLRLGGGDGGVELCRLELRPAGAPQRSGLESTEGFFGCTRRPST